MNAADEPPIDLSLANYMEERALAIARAKSADSDRRFAIERLVELRSALQQYRHSFWQEATRKRHARGEIYSAARVAAINSMAGERGSMDRDIKTLYEDQPDAITVLKNHARTHFVFALVSSRVILRSNTPDILDAARAMQQMEEDFAAAWMDAIDDAEFSKEVREGRRDALRTLRTSTRPIFLATRPETPSISDDAALTLAKVWNKLDALATGCAATPLSAFIGLPDEDTASAELAAAVLTSVEALQEKLQDGGVKLPSKRAAVAALAEVRDAIRAAIASNAQATAAFEVDL